MKRTPSIVAALRRESVALRSAPRRDLAPVVEAALVRDRRARRRRAVSLVACAALVAAAVVLRARETTPEAGLLARRERAPETSHDRMATSDSAPSWSLDPGRILHLGGTWWGGLEVPLRRELEGLTQDARKVASAVVRRLPESLSARWDG